MRRRAEQARSLNTRALILNAALSEFAEKGFENASIRGIAERLGLQHPLITYHYPTLSEFGPEMRQRQGKGVRLRVRRRSSTGHSVNRRG